MSVSSLTAEPALQACGQCGFILWNPLGSVGCCDVGLYDDARFPGRLLVSYRPHMDHFDEMSDGALIDFMTTIRTLSRLLRDITSADRVNVAILGNTEPHVHAHLIPRIAHREPEPRKSPWDDPRPREPLNNLEKARLMYVLPRRLHLDGSSSLQAGAAQVADDSGA